MSTQQFVAKLQKRNRARGNCACAEHAKTSKGICRIQKILQVQTKYDAHIPKKYIDILVCYMSDFSKPEKL